MNVAVGLSTKTGYGVSLTAYALAIVAFLQGDRSDQTTGVIVAGTIGTLSLLITQAGRYLQAHAATRARPAASSPRRALAPAADDDSDLPADELPPEALELKPTHPNEVPPDQGDIGPPIPA